MPDFSSFPRGVPGRDDDLAHDNIARIIRESKAQRAMWTHPSKLLDAASRWKYEPGKIFLGELNGRLIGVSDNRHMTTVAGNRAGKGVSAIIPNLCEYPGPMLVIDPKGENAHHTASRRGKGSRTVKNSLGQDVFVLDPFGISGHPTSFFNPLDMIDPDGDTAVDDAALIADALVIQEEGPGRHFSAAARNWLRGLILFVCTDVHPESRNLNFVRQLLTLGPESFKKLLEDMHNETRCDGVIRRTADSLAAKAENERSGVISTAIEQTDFLDSKLLAKTLERSSFHLADLKRNPKGMTVYLCLPARFMDTHSRWLRVIVNLALAAMEQERTKPKHRVVFLIDEAAVLNRLSSLEKAAGQIAGLDVTLWCIWQDLSQLSSIYGDRWETFLGNSGLIQAFGNHDLTTLDHLEKRLGKTTIAHVAQGEISMQQSASGFTGKSIQLHECPLMTADEIGRFFSRQSEAQLLLWPGAAPIAIDRIKYYEHPHFAGKFDL